MHDVATMVEAVQGAPQAPSFPEHPCLFSRLLENAAEAMRDDSPAGNLQHVFALPWCMQRASSPWHLRQRDFGLIPPRMIHAGCENESASSVNRRQEDGWVRKFLVIESFLLIITQALSCRASSIYLWWKARYLAASIGGPQLDSETSIAMPSDILGQDCPLKFTGPLPLNPLQDCLEHFCALRHIE